MENKKKTLVLIDGNALIHRSYHALPPLTTKKGEVVHAVYGFTSTLLSVLEKFHPEYIAASFDLKGKTFRDDLYADYKATRTKAPDDLYAQIPRVKEVVTAMNIPIYELAGFEADDCVGTIAKQAGAQGVEVIIVTGDNDALQLVDDHIKVFSIRKGLKDLVLYDVPAVVAKYEFGPNQLPDYKGLAGDNSDNIPGVAGIGAKTATDLLKQFGTLENIYANLSDVKESVRKKLEADKEKAFLSKTLGAICIDAPVTLDLEKCVAKDYDKKLVGSLLSELGFFSLLKRLPGAEISQQLTDNNKQKEKKEKIKIIKTEEDLLKFFGTDTRVGVWLEKGMGSLFGTALESVGVATEKSAGIISWNEETKKFLQTFFENESIGKVAFDGKSIMRALMPEKIAVKNIAFDVEIAAYILSAGSDVSFERLILSELGMEEISGAGEKARAVWELEKHFSKQMDEMSREQIAGKTVRTVFETIEMPLIPILAEMEESGIRLNTEKFRALSVELSLEITGLEQEIYKYAGREFNINSPKQLAEILFVELKIPTVGVKKTKTGISTASPELIKLKAEYPIAGLIEQYRELFKLKTTYLDALPLLVDSKSRLHTTFHQAVAATGRLSSSNPNLQNIPARNAWSEKIRGAFEVEEGHLFVGSDYSQIELRVMAHLSDDPALVEAFRKGEDVHRTTGAVVFKVAPELVTNDMRRQAKVFNFGLMYGMGAFGLAQAAEIGQKEAGEFIKAYFAKFPKVAEFMESMKVSAREKGFVETELGRRRAVPEIRSENVMVARSGERMAINMPVQGLAADIMKLSMLAAEKLVKEYNSDVNPDEALRVKMLLQVHDELIFEVKESVAERFAKDLKQVMENAYTLKVPLIVETSIGKNWGEI
ncbi:MAG: DNA polymerase I [Candidatus Moranbacteria bacterium]|nr:DNA polymerase I [Candidatus Moranbacteria bacterium]